MATLRKLIHDFRWWLAGKINALVWVITPDAEEERRQAGPDHASARLAAEWDRQQNYQPSAEEARDLAERQRNVIRWPK